MPLCVEDLTIATLCAFSKAEGRGSPCSWVEMRFRDLRVESRDLLNCLQLGKAQISSFGLEWPQSSWMLQVALISYILPDGSDSTV